MAWPSHVTSADQELHEKEEKGQTREVTGGEEANGKGPPGTSPVTLEQLTVLSLSLDVVSTSSLVSLQLLRQSTSQRHFPLLRQERVP
jgi:hypothetical protein